jgi:TetR/AcrR family transcriptional regulator, transcriptional repressor for nem operon
MRYTADHKEQTHRRIVQTAARAFKKHGLQGVGIADLMKKAGLTHGGFYAHFPDRDTLVAEATAAGYEEAAERLIAALAEKPADERVEAFLDRYLGEAHRAHAENGCPLPALAADMSRQPVPVRRTFTEQFRRYGSKLAALLPSRYKGDREATALAVLSGVAGAVMLARAVSDPDLSDRILAASRQFYLDALQHTPKPTKS